MNHETTPQEITNGRYWQILRFFGGMILHFILWDVLGGRLPGVRSRVQQSRPERFRLWARRFRAIALNMGGVMIKLGQFLSARVDVLPVEITSELQGLQDEVPSVPWTAVQQVLVNEPNAFLSHFSHIEEKPVAAASLGQAHRAQLRRGAESLSVIIKVQRPSIEKIVRVDLQALEVVAHWVMRYPPIGRRANVPALMQEFAKTLWEELDYRAEIGNAAQFAAMYADDPQIYIPIIYEAYCSERVIVLEDVEAIKIADKARLEAEGVNPAEVADVLLDAYFRQVFKEGFFHADPHPGNLFVRPLGEVAEGGRPFLLIFIDFGMVGRVPQLMGDNLRKVLISVTQRDARQLTEAYKNLGFFLPGADLERIIEAQEVLLERIWGRKLLDLARPDPAEVQELGREFRDILFDFPFQIPQDFIYLGRALGMVSGLISVLNPDINPWYQIERYGEELIGIPKTAQAGLETVWDLLRPYVSTPGRVQRLLTAVENGRFRLPITSDRETLQRLEKLDKRLNQLSWSILGAASLISAVIWWQKDRD